MRLLLVGVRWILDGRLIDLIASWYSPLDDGPPRPIPKPKSLRQMVIEPSKPQQTSNQK